MFNIFKQSNSLVSINDKVWLSKDAKWKACVKIAEANAACVFVAWFKQTREALEKQFIESQVKAHLMIAHDLIEPKADSIYIFVEHHPLASHEQKLFALLKLKEAPVLSSMDEPLFTLFGGDSTVRLMKRLGMENDEIVDHPMITKSINRAQKKIEKKVSVEQRAESQQAWFEMNKIK